MSLLREEGITLSGQQQHLESTAWAKSLSLLPSPSPSTSSSSSISSSTQYNQSQLQFLQMPYSRRHTTTNTQQTSIADIEKANETNTALPIDTSKENQCFIIKGMTHHNGHYQSLSDFRMHILANSIANRALHAIRPQWQKHSLCSLQSPSTTNVLESSQTQTLNGVKDSRHKFSDFQQMQRQIIGSDDYQKAVRERRRLYHKKHERSRRKELNNYYRQLTELVSGKKLTKSAMLAKAAEWLEELLYGNAQLVTQIELIRLDAVTDTI